MNSIHVPEIALTLLKLLAFITSAVYSDLNADNLLTSYLPPVIFLISSWWLFGIGLTGFIVLLAWAGFALFGSDSIWTNLICAAFGLIVFGYAAVMGKLHQASANLFE